MRTELAAPERVETTEHREHREKME